MQLLTFKIRGCWYALPVDCVQEVSGGIKITPVPRVSPFVLGLINLRGQIAATIDLLALFKAGSVQSQSDKHVVCNFEGIHVSFLIEEEGDVIEIERMQIQAPPCNLNESMGRYVEGIVETAHGNVTFLSVSQIVKQFKETQKAS